MNSPRPNGAVSGSLYGSFFGLLTALLIPLLAIFVPLAIFGVVRLAAPVGIAVGGSAGVHTLRRKSRLTVSSDGISIAQFAVDAFVPWDNVDSISEQRFGAKLVFKEPQRIGMRSKTYPFDTLDHGWRRRSTSIAILRELERHQVATDEVQ